MNKSNLETFLTLAKEGSFSRTANKLSITQPAASKRIASLEKELNTQLIDRSGKSTRLTHSGTILLEHASKLLNSMQDCQTAINNTNRSIEGPLKLGVSHHIGLHRLPPTLKSYSQNFPNVQLQIEFVDSEEAYKKVQSGELEIALATLSPQEKPHIHQAAVWQDPLSFVVSGNHPLAQQPAITLNTLTQHPAILPGPTTYTGQLIQTLFQREQCIINRAIETNYLETIRMMVSIGLGWAVLPRTMLNRQLHGLSINSAHLTRELGYIQHQERTTSNASRALIHILQQQSSPPYNQKQQHAPDI